MHSAVNAKIPSKLHETDITIYMMQKGFSSFSNKCSCYRDIRNSSLSLSTSCDLRFLRNSSPNIVRIGYNFPLPKNCPFPLCELLKWKRLSASDLGTVVGSYFATSKTVALWRETMSLKGCFSASVIQLLVSKCSTGQHPPLQWHGEGTVFISQLAQGSSSQVWNSLGSFFALKLYQGKQWS